ncbi:MAG: hypothetical protein WDN09_01315 [bacterium]
MGFESPQTPKEMHEIQPALKKIIEKIAADFDRDERYWGTFDYKGPASERFHNLDVHKLIKLHLAVGELRSTVFRLKKDFGPQLDESQTKLLEDIEDIANEIIHSEHEVELMKKWETAGQDDTVTVNAELANILGNQVHALEEGVAALVKIFQ